jgi:CubicO group peptidase (beta-lactamase class C family)
VRIAVLFLLASCKSKPIEVARKGADVPAISVAVVRDARVARTEVAGDAREETAFEAASIGKPIVAICVMHLVEQKKLSLDEEPKLPFVLRNQAFPNDPITLRMLLTHTSSMHDRDLRAVRGDPSTLEDFLRAYVAPDAGGFSAREPGDSIEYSNVGVSVAALAVERASGERFDAYARAHVFDPAGAKHTTYGRPENAARPHLGANALEPIAHAVYPVVDLYAPASELAAIAAALLRGELVSAASRDQMFAEHLGWQSLDLDGRALVGHEGEDDGASTMMFLDPKTKSAAIILTNGDAFASGDAARAEALKTLLKSLIL